MADLTLTSGLDGTFIKRWIQGECEKQFLEIIEVLHDCVANILHI